MMRHEDFQRLASAASKAGQEQAQLHAKALRHVGPDFATAAEAARYLRLSPRRICDVLKEMDAPVNAAGRVPWRRLWKMLWQIQEVPETAHDIMMQPLLTVSDVAARVGVTERSIIRDTDRAYPRYGLPRHVQLSERARRFHPTMVELWELQEPLPEWMRPEPVRPRLPRGVRPRPLRSDGPLAPHGQPASDNPEHIGKNDNRPFV